MEVTNVITTQMKNLSLIKVLAILMVIVVPLLEMDQTAYADTASSSQVTVIASHLNVREASDISSKIIGLVHKGDTFEIIRTSNNWDQIKLSSTQTGWVYNAYVKKVKKSAEDNALNIRENPGYSSHVASNVKLEKILTDQEGPKPLNGKTIVLDPGHGGIDNGTTSIVGTPEKTLNLATATVVKQKLENAGAKVVMTRTNDTYVSLQQRADFSNNNHADAFISFHYNWSNNPSANGLTDFYYQKSKDNALASNILNEVAKTTGLTNIGTRFNDLNVLRSNSQPSTLIELGFLSNKQDDSFVESSTYPDKVAQGIYLGLLDYFHQE
jgi:N-acetylmuramoyl-L-alanine amidase